MSFVVFVKKAPLNGAFFVGLVLSSAAYAIEDADCELKGAAEIVTAEHVHDGDTLRLHDGRKVRLIGINTPERAREERVTEPLAEQARMALQNMIGRHRQIRLVLGSEQKDRYGRILAHPFSLDGENLTASLLKLGYGQHIVVPPNLKYYSCYRNSETSARLTGKGVWQHAYYRPRNIEQLKPEYTGYQTVSGTITHIGNSRKSIWLNFGERFSVHINRNDLSYFATWKFSELKGKVVEVRGWLRYYKGKQQFRMQVRHPAAIVINQKHS